MDSRRLGPVVGLGNTCEGDAGVVKDVVGPAGTLKEVGGTAATRAASSRKTRVRVGALARGKSSGA
jgi:hypothetical protein